MPIPSRTALVAGLLAATACSAQPQPSAAATDQPVASAPDAPVAAASPPAAPPVTSLPDDAPATNLRNVPATTGRANLPKTQPPFAIQQIGQFDAPFGMAFLPDGQLLVTQKGGQLKLRAASGQVADVIGVPAVETGGQGGLLDIAVAPDAATSRTVYLSFAEPGPGGSQLALARATLAQAGQPRLNELKVIWRSGRSGVGGQFGAVIAFAPDGQSLFLTSGERQRFTPAQDPDQALGKIIHLTLDGQPFPGNPQAAAGGVPAQTWTSGHRNPYGLVFAPDGKLWEIEMGPKGGDELNLIEPGKNYGWPTVSNGDNYDGKPIPDHPSAPQFATPALWWNPSISPAGLIIYTGAMFPQYRGSAFLGAMSGQALVRVAIDGATAKPGDQWDMGARIRDVAQAPDGAIWLLVDGDAPDGGKLLRLTPKR